MDNPVLAQRIKDLEDRLDMVEKITFNNTSLLERLFAMLQRYFEAKAGK